MIRNENAYSSFRSKALIYFLASLELHSGSPEISSAVEDGMGGWCERGWEDGMRGAEVGKGLGGTSKVEI